MGWEMPGQVFPPESFGPWAIEGERLTAASKTRVEPASNRLFMSVLRDTERELEPGLPGSDISANSGIAVRWRLQVDCRHACKDRQARLFIPMLSLAPLQPAAANMPASFLLAKLFMTGIAGVINRRVGGGDCRLVVGFGCGDE